MLGKLLKYDFKALNRVMLPLQGATLVAGMLGCFFVNFSFRSLATNITQTLSQSPSYSTSSLEQMLYLCSSLLAGLFLSVVFASSWVTLFLIARHFYNNFLKDEGYLTFTLPVTTNQNLLSKTIVGGVWTLINLVVLSLVMVVLTLVGFSTEGLISEDVLKVYGEIFSVFGATQGTVLIVESIAVCLIGAVFSVLMVYVSLVIGASIARTYKALAGVGIYVGISFVIQILLSAVYIVVVFCMASGTTTSSVLSPDYFFNMMQMLLLPILVIYAICPVVFHLVSKHLLSNKLNLD